MTYSNVLRRLRDNRLRYAWTREQEQETVLRGRFAGSGAQVQFSPQQPGEYRLVIEAKNGCPVVRSKNGCPVVRPPAPVVLLVVLVLL